MSVPVIRAVSQMLIHAPGLAHFGSKPSRELPRDPELAHRFQHSLRDFPTAVAYPPNQTFIGGLTPEDLAGRPRPWYEHPVPAAQRQGAFGEILPEEEFFGWLKVVDHFDLVHLEAGFAKEARARLAEHPLIQRADLEALSGGLEMAEAEAMVQNGEAVRLSLRDGRTAGCLRHGRSDDVSLQADILVENLAAKASAVLAVRHLLAGGVLLPGEVDYLINTGEEAVGDRYQRGAGNLGKAVGECCGCANATGGDVKAFCCAPVHALVVAGALVQSGVFRNVLVIGGGSLAKLGMKSLRHLQRNLPVMEDVLGAFAVWVGPDDGISPVLRLDCVGKHDISAAASAEAIYERLVLRPLDGLGLRLTDIDKYAVELHNPEVTETGGSGDVARTNYRILASLALRRGEIAKEEFDSFLAARGMPGFSPTQGHVPAGIPYLGHALRALKEGRLRRVMVVAKGSLFLGMMTRMADGMSILIERNPGQVG